MKNRFCHILSAVAAGLILATTMPARSQDPMKPSEAIHTGILASGVPYYLATSATERGMADFTLLCDSACAPQPRALLAALPHFAPGGPARFLAAHGCSPGSEGWIGRRDGVVLFRFPGVRLSSDAVRDSTLLLLFDLLSSTPGGSHALIVAGDIQPEACKTAMHYLSLQLPPGEAQAFPDRYSWQAIDTATFVRSLLSSGENPFVELSWRLPRIGRAQLKTIQPYVSGLYAYTLGSILTRRLRTVCLSGQIPYGTIDYQYLPTSESGGDERFTIRVSTDSAHVDRMVEVLAETLSAVDSRGVFPDEYHDATERIRGLVSRQAARSLNAWLTDRCIAASLYGSDLADLAAVSRFLSSRKVEPARERMLFQGYASALLDSAANLTLTLAGSRNSDPLERFRRSWTRRDTTLIYSYVNNKADTLNLSVAPVKVKCRKVAPEPVSGGEIWTFSNGMQVVFKRTGGEIGHFRFGWMLRGGYPAVPELSPGEGAFVGDMLRLGYVGPLRGIDFYNMLEASRIELQPEAGLQGLRLIGNAPSQELELVIRSLLELSRSRKVDRQAFETYRENETLHIAEGDRVGTVMWKALRPSDFRYSDRKEIGNLTDSLPEKAERYFRSRFASCQDGVLVLIGDLDPDYTRRLLCRWLGALVTNPVQGRPAGPIAYQPHAGTRILYRTAPEAVTPQCRFLMQAPLLYTSKNVHALSMAGLYLADCLTRALAPLGLRSEVRTGFAAYPEGWMDVDIALRPVDPEQLPDGVVPPDPLMAASALRSAIREAAATSVSDGMLAFYRRYWEDRVTAGLTGEASLIKAVLKRYSEGKDFMTGYRQLIGEVSAADIASILQTLAEGARIEYIEDP